MVELHEGPVTESILKIVLEYAEKHNARTVNKVSVVIGKMTGYEESPIRFYWEALSSGTVAEGAELEVIYTPISVKCQSCGEVYEPEDQYSLFCPNCGFYGGEIKSGKELFVDSIEID
ncbi:MAG: hydrogenase maturation nickel metallochaperone HypA [Actinobacteria bacterium]|nr:hydrogenase maturation nickel metallochaperone HypA [Actinomycetota bacterium]